jgi:hypothetical protein
MTAKFRLHRRLRYVEMDVGTVLADLSLTCYGLRRLVTGFPPRRPGLEPGSGHVGFVANNVTLG